MFWNYQCSVIFVFLFINGSDAKKCKSLQNVYLYGVQLDGAFFNITSFSGCIERIAFENMTISELYIHQQNVTDIGEDTVRHLVRLKTLVFIGCPIQAIQPKAFRNLPRIRTIQISYGNLTKIPEEIFSDLSSLRTIRLHDNQISSIEEEAFWNLPELEKLYFAKNRLTSWQNSWWVNTTNLEIIDFSKNSIEVIPRRAFYGMTKLKKLLFDFNEIKLIETEAFKSVRELDYLGLKHNRLKQFDERIFPNRLSITTLSIGANYLNYLSNEVLQKVSVKELTIDGNPWKCPCLDRIHYWLFTANGTIKSSPSCTGSDIPTCSYPVTYSKTCLENVDEQLTRNFIESLRNLKNPLKNFCARLD